MAQDSAKKQRMMRGGNAGAGGGLYGLGFIGAVVFYVQQASTFGAGIVGVLKALVWPAFLVYDLLKFIK
ncbi:MAG TPA: hypothetical protein VMR45_04450 [Patescibacteria group bacterium]|nr:hypothetical protein [Patescibacteria group bacterium]